MAGGCRARPSACPVGMVSKTVRGLTRPWASAGRIDDSPPRGSVRGPSLLISWAGKCDRLTGIASTRDRLTTGMVGHGPCAAAIGVGTLTDAHIRSWSRARALAGRWAGPGGSSTEERNSST